MSMLCNGWVSARLLIMFLSYVSSVTECCQVMFDYKAQTDDELVLKKGDIVMIISKVWTLVILPCYFLLFSSIFSRCILVIWCFRNIQEAHLQLHAKKTKQKCRKKKKNRTWYHFLHMTRPAKPVVSVCEKIREYMCHCSQDDAAGLREWCSSLSHTVSVHSKDFSDSFDDILIIITVGHGQPCFAWPFGYLWLWQFHVPVDSTVFEVLIWLL